MIKALQLCPNHHSTKCKDYKAELVLGEISSSSNMTMWAARFAMKFRDAISLAMGFRVAPLFQLQFHQWTTGTRQLKLREALLSALMPPYTDIQHVPAWLYALSLLTRHAPGSCHAAFEQLAREMMDAVESCLQRLIVEMQQVGNPCFSSLPTSAP